MYSYIILYIILYILIFASEGEQMLLLFLKPSLHTRLEAYCCPIFKSRSHRKSVYIKISPLMD